MMDPQLEVTEDGLEIIDPIDGYRNRIVTPNSTIPVQVETSNIPYAVESAYKITTSEFDVLFATTAYIHDDENLIVEIEPTQKRLFDKSKYIVEFTSPINIYCCFEGEFSIYSDIDQAHIQFSEPTQVILGLRSYHTQPAGTVITTSDPRDLMEAISSFGSALKTKSVGKSYPTLRDHPPLLKVGDELVIPSEFERSETTTEIEVPPELQYVFPIAPLVYYLGATVIPGPRSKINTGTGHTYPLTGKEGFETITGRVLKQVFFLDCVVRDEGDWPVPSCDFQDIKAKLDFDLKKVYNDTPAQQIKTYLEIPYSTIEPYIPNWPITTHIATSTDYIEFLPFAVNNLSIISVEKKENNRATNYKLSKYDEKGEPVINQTWYTIGSTDVISTVPLSAFYHKMKIHPRTGPLKITVICNDPDMNEEFVNAHGKYNERIELPSDIEFLDNLKKNELQEVLASDSDFVHYIGHIDSEGFRCIDGKLDASEVEYVGSKAFFLNSCQSFEQGLHLIKSGSIGGIVTLDAVENKEAVEIGSLIARLLNYGFPLYAALDIAQLKNPASQPYHLIGDGKTGVSQTGVPIVCSIDRDDRKNDVEFYAYMRSNSNLGGVYQPYLESIDNYNIEPGKTEPTSVTIRELLDFLEIEPTPALLDGKFRWSDNIKLREL